MNLKKTIKSFSSNKPLFCDTLLGCFLSTPQAASIASPDNTSTVALPTTAFAW